MDEFTMSDQALEVANLFGGTWVPETIEDSEGIDFNTPIKGKYICEITGIEHRAGTSDKTGNDYEFLTLKMKVTDDIDGDKSHGRFLDKTFFAGTHPTYNPDDEDKWKKDLCNCLHTASLALPPNADVDTFVAHGDKLKGSTVNVTAYKSKAGNQVVRIVKSFKMPGEKKETTFEIS